MTPVYFAVLFTLLDVKLICSSVNESDTNLQNTATSDRSFLFIHKSNNTNMEVMMYDKNSSEFRKRRERTRKRKEKNGRSKKKLHRPFDFIDRNNEKIDLVRNRTVEILRKGTRILDAQKKPAENKSKPTFRINSTSVEKILSHSFPKKNIYSSIYTLPIGFDIPKNTKSEEIEDKPIVFEPEDSSNKKNNSYKNDSNDSEHVNAETVLEQMKVFLKNLTDCPNQGCGEGGNNTQEMNNEDPCLKWLRCKKKLDLSFLGDGNSLPSCPCTYPSSIFYDNAIWDVKLKRYFKWRDASGEAEKINIYKPGAAHCIRSLIVQGVPNLSSQHCCYDSSQLLLTRGSGAGTVNFVSPDASKALHFAVDILPWRLCKGDFTRYNSARIPNNGNNCPENPNDEMYELEVKVSQNY